MKKKTREKNRGENLKKKLYFEWVIKQLNKKLLIKSCKTNNTLKLNFVLSHFASFSKITNPSYLSYSMFEDIGE